MVLLKEMNTDNNKTAIESTLFPGHRSRFLVPGINQSLIRGSFHRSIPESNPEHRDVNEQTAAYAGTGCNLLARFVRPADDKF